MAARLRALVVVVAALVVACGSATTPDQPVDPPRQTPSTSLSPQMSGTAALLTDALAQRAIRLDPAVASVQPGEPASLANVPRGILQADVLDPDGGYVLIYEFPDSATAATRGTEFADYLESGFGQTNYPLDTQFSLSQIGGTLAYTWWSAERSADRERARLAFDTIASVGQPIPIVK